MKIDKALLDSLTQKAKDGAYEPIGEEDILYLLEIFSNLRK